VPFSEEILFIWKQILCAQGELPETPKTLWEKKMKHPRDEA
jgi:hypothetical protein